MAPVVITLVSDGARCLLARQSSFPRGLYSALAGFCDIGKEFRGGAAVMLGDKTPIATMLRVTSIRHCHSRVPEKHPGVMCSFPTQQEAHFHPCSIAAGITHSVLPHPLPPSCVHFNTLCASVCLSVCPAIGPSSFSDEQAADISVLLRVFLG